MKSAAITEKYITGFRNGEEKSFDFFFRQYYDALCFFSFKITGNKFVGEEIASDSFIKLWKRRTGFSNLEGIRGFLYKVTLNGSLNYLRSSKRLKRATNDYIYLLDGTENNIQDRLIEAEVYRQIYLAIDRLPPQCRKIFIKLLSGKKTDQIAKELKLSVDTVRSQKARALVLLKGQMDSSCYEVLLVILGIVVISSN